MEWYYVVGNNNGNMFILVEWSKLLVEWMVLIFLENIYEE